MGDAVGFDHAGPFEVELVTFEAGSPTMSSDVTDASDPIATKLNALPKYVASTTAGSVDWHNSSLLGGDVVAEVTKLKQGPGNELRVHGSSGLAQTLIEHDLVDEYRLLFFPVHLGSGKSSSATAQGPRPCASPAPRRQVPGSSSPPTSQPGPRATARTHSKGPNRCETPGALLG